MIEKELKEIIFMELKKIVPECDPVEIHPDESIREALDMDSYSFNQLIYGVSNSSGVDISTVDYEKVFTLGKMMRHLSAYVS